jgi:YegS/Rv2252/BmrU family lipid kinase
LERKIIYLVNPISGTRVKSSLPGLISRKHRVSGISYEILDTNAEGNYSFLQQKIRNENISDVVICGGDGTVNAVASCLIGIQVQIGILPMGSGNGLALAAGIPHQSEKALEIVLAGKASFIDGFFINKEFSCMLCGIGFDAEVAHEFAREKKRGLNTYIKVGAIQFFKTNPYPFEIKMKNRSISVDAFFISIANGNQFGNNFTIAPKAKLNDGLIDVVIVKKMSKFLMPFSVLNQVAGFNRINYLNDFQPDRHVLYFQVPSLSINNPDLAPLHIDGDPKETAARFDIRVIPKALKLIQP